MESEARFCVQQRNRSVLNPHSLKYRSEDVASRSTCLNIGVVLESLHTVHCPQA